MAFVRLEKGTFVTAQLTDLCDKDVEIGMPVEMVTRKIRTYLENRGSFFYEYKLRPVMQA